MDREVIFKFEEFDNHVLAVYKVLGVDRDRVYSLRFDYNKKVVRGNGCYYDESICLRFDWFYKRVIDIEEARSLWECQVEYGFYNSSETE
jgi:hypothetical protein